MFGKNQKKKKLRRRKLKNGKKKKAEKEEKEEKEHLLVVNGYKKVKMSTLSIWQTKKGVTMVMVDQVTADQVCSPSP